MTSRPTLRAIVFGLVAAATLACAAPAHAYTYTFINGSKQTVTQIWMHTVSAFCHDVTWRGNLRPGARVQISSASICLVDRVEMINGPNWSAGSGHATGFFIFDSNKVCFADLAAYFVTGGIYNYLQRC